VHKVKSFHILIFLSVLISILIGTRLPHVGKDTEAYKNHFYNSSIADGVYERSEIGFSLLMQLFSKTIPSVELFFSVVAFIITLTYMYTFRKIYSKCFFDIIPSTSVMISFFSLLLVSSWYIASTTNGLRQGLSLVFLYWACVELFFNSKKIKFITLFILAISFHYSALLIIPFLLLRYLRFSFVFFIWTLAGLGYTTGANELVVKIISETLNLPIYQYVKYYSLEKGSENLGGGLYVGFNMSFFIYTLFWPVLLLMILKIKSRFKSKLANIDNIYILLKIYFVLSLIYFIMGFGPFSNRYALFSWFLIPIIQIVIINLSLNLNSKRIVPLLAFFSSLIIFLYIKLDWIGFILQ
jgi:hypothetical protein